MINQIPNTDVLCNKVDLAHSFDRLPNQYRDFWPRRFFLPEQDSTLSEGLEAERDIFIIKPANGSLGVGVCLYRPGRSLSCSEIGWMGCAELLESPMRSAN
jgi:hypothetical protein